MIQPWDIPAAPAAASFAETLRAALPELRTDRCILRAPRLEDAPLWVSLMVPDTEGHLGGPHTEAEAYAQRNGIAYTVQPAHDATPKRVSYPDNFRADRKTPWTH